MTSAINIGILLVLGAAVFGGLVRGLRRELLNLVGIVLALAGGIFLAKPVASLFRSWGVIEEVPYLLAFICGFIVVSLGFSLIKGPLIPKEIDLAERIAGALLGLAKGMLSAAILLYILVGIWPQSAQSVGRAPAARIIMPVTAAVDALAGAIRPLLPEELTGQVRDGFKFFKETRDSLEKAVESEGEGILPIPPV